MTAKSKAAVRGEQSLMFFKEYLRKPRDIGSAMPSGPRLTDLMIRALALPDRGCVVELGPGTGVFTAALIAAGIRPERLLLIERNREFADFLRGRFPQVAIVSGDAQELPALLASRKEANVSRIVSGLPLRSMDRAARLSIAQATSEALAPGGRFVQFTYLSGPPIARQDAARLNLLGARYGVAFGNMPPAFVWQYVRMS
jgi:phosphatidylethanolamine/phosphatidyl-N-methylethanolamine N-methyltransferase